MLWDASWGTNSRTYQGRARAKALKRLMDMRGIPMKLRVVVGDRLCAVPRAAMLFFQMQEVIFEFLKSYDCETSCFLKQCMETEVVLSQLRLLAHFYYCFWHADDMCFPGNDVCRKSCVFSRIFPFVGGVGEESSSQ